MNNIKTTYRDIEINYNEHNNDWRAEGYRNKDTLVEMRSAIDRKLGHEEKIPFAKFNAVYIKSDYGQSVLEEVTVTSFTDNGEMWTSANKERKKVWKHSINSYRHVDADKITAWNALNSQINELKQQRDALFDSMKVVEVPELQA